MKKSNRKYILIALISLTIFGSYFFMHENSHYSIYRKFNITDVNVSIEFGGISMYPNQTQVDNLDEQSQRELRLSQSFAEAIGYNIFPMLLALVFIFIRLMEK